MRRLYLRRDFIGRMGDFIYFKRIGFVVRGSLINFACYLASNCKIRSHLKLRQSNYSNLKLRRFNMVRLANAT